MTTIVQAKKRMNILLTHSFGDPAFYTRFNPTLPIVTQYMMGRCDLLFQILKARYPAMLFSFV